MHELVCSSFTGADGDETLYVMLYLTIYFRGLWGQHKEPFLEHTPPFQLTEQVINTGSQTGC